MSTKLRRMTHARVQASRRDRARRRPGIRSFLAAFALGGTVLDDAVAAAGPPATPVPSVEVRLDRGHAEVVVRRSFANTSDAPKLLDTFLPVSDGAVVTRLRTAPTAVPEETAWTEADLRSAAAAETTFTRGGGGRTGALLGWSSGPMLPLVLYPVPARGLVTVEYTVRLPVTYADGRYRFHLPALADEGATANVHLVAASAGDVLQVGGTSFANGATIPSAGNVDVSLRPGASPPLEGALGSVATGTRHVVGLRIAAGDLGAAPARADVVVVIDASRSMRHAFEAELALAQGYLAGFPSAEVLVLTFDRAVHSPFGRAVPVATALRRLSSLALFGANGSNVDDALFVADRALARSTAGRERRILLLGDFLGRAALSVDHVMANTATSRALVHVVQVGAAYDTWLRRDDTLAWARLARASGGLSWTAGARAGNDASARVTFEELVRPLRIDHLAITGLPEGWSPPEELVAGAAVTAELLAPTPIDRVTLRGELWSTPLRWTVDASEAEGRRVAGLAIARPIFEELDADEKLVVAMKGHALSSVSSYVTAGPKPPLRDGALVGGQAGGVIGGDIGDYLGEPGPPPAFDRRGFLECWLAKTTRVCGGIDAALTIETTLAEVVDVRHVRASGRPGTDTCVRERLWQLSLPDGFRLSHETFALGPSTERACTAPVDGEPGDVPAQTRP